MGYGDHLMQAAVAREMCQRSGKKVVIYYTRENWKKLIGRYARSIVSPMWVGNPAVANAKLTSGGEVFDGYCSLSKAYSWIAEVSATHIEYLTYDRHIIETLANRNGIFNCELKCDLFLTEQENEKVVQLAAQLPREFVAIEPASKMSWTPNRIYPFAKWQAVVDSLHAKIPFVQIGLAESPLLKNVIDLTGQTTFRETAGIIGKSKLLLTTEGGMVHLATAMNTTAVVIFTGFQTVEVVGYPQNININIARHGPCGLRIPCKDCIADAAHHDWHEVADAVKNYLGL